MNGYIVLKREKWYVGFERFSLNLLTAVCLFCLLFVAAFQIWINTAVTGRYDSLISVYGVAYQKDVRALKEQISMLPEWVMNAYQKEGNRVYLSGVPLDRIAQNEEENKITLGLHQRRNNGSKIWVLNTAQGIEKAPLHEFGHFIDHYFWKTSDRADFQECYEHEKDIFFGLDGNEHHISNPAEFFAESVSWYIKNPEMLQEFCPQTYDYIRVIFIWGDIRA